jgi:hypothetical protein
MAAAYAGTVHKTTVGPPVSYTIPEIKKDSALCRLLTGTAKVGRLNKKKLSARYHGYYTPIIGSQCSSTR